LVQDSIPMLKSLAGLTRWHPPAELALVEIALGDYAAAECFAEESLAAGREMDVPPRVAAALDALGKIAYLAGDYFRAQQHCREALALFEAMGTRYEIASCLDALANATRARGEYEPAGELLDRAQAIADEIGAWPLSLEVRVSRAALVLAELRGTAPGQDVLQQAQDLLDRPLHDARAFAHTRDHAENLRAKLGSLSQEGG
jgi:tetratricopeptide (TPR) repeat protein